MLRIETRLHEDAPPFGQLNLNRAAVRFRRLRRSSLDLNLDELFSAGWLSRFFQAKNCPVVRPRSRQNTATLCPLPLCSAINPRHFTYASRHRPCILPLCGAA